MNWYEKIVHSSDDLSSVLDACDHFDEQYKEAQQEVALTTLRGQRVIDIQKMIPGITEYRFAQLQEIEAILGFLEIREQAIKGQRRRHYLEHYNRALNASTVEKYVEADEQVIEMATLRNHLAFVRNKFLGITKHHACLHFQLSNITRLLERDAAESLY